jgi:bacterioferritin-associated ferredoxin
VSRRHVIDTSWLEARHVTELAARCGRCQRLLRDMVTEGHSELALINEAYEAYAALTPELAAVIEAFNEVAPHGPLCSASEACA